MEQENTNVDLLELETTLQSQLNLLDRCIGIQSHKKSIASIALGAGAGLDPAAIESSPLLTKILSFELAGFDASLDFMQQSKQCVEIALQQVAEAKAKDATSINAEQLFSAVADVMTITDDIDADIQG